MKNEISKCCGVKIGTLGNCLKCAKICSTENTPVPAREEKCRCHINAKYKSDTAWKTGKLPTPCPVHEKEMLNLPAEKQVNYLQVQDGGHCLLCHSDYAGQFHDHIRIQCLDLKPTPCIPACGKWFKQEAEGWSKFYELSKTMDGQFRPKLRLWIEQTRKEAYEQASADMEHNMENTAWARAWREMAATEAVEQERQRVKEVLNLCENMYGRGDFGVIYDTLRDKLLSPEK